jgi:hypothetical protein
MAGRPALVLAALLALDVPPVTDAAMRETTDRLVTEVGGAREIKLRGPLERHLVNRAEARAGIEGAMTAALAGSDLGTDEAILQRLGLLPPGSDYVRLIADAYGDSPSASYDAASRRLYVPDWIPLDRQRAVLAHEIDHALTDQRFGLRRFLQIDGEGRHHLSGDAERARQALIEGDATTVALEVTDPRGAFLGTRELAATATRLREAAGASGGKWNPWLRAVALFTQVDGFQMVARVRARQSWSGVDALWAAPPASTEQVLHPEKYEAGEAPVPVEIAPLAATLEPAGLRPTGSEVLGELGVRTWLETAVPPEIASRAAAGWGGDRAVLYAPAVEAARDAGAAPEPALAWLTVWDDAVDAEDFARAAAAALAKLAGDKQAPPLDEHGHVALRSASGLYALAWRGDAVALLAGAPDDAEPALAEMLDGWKKQHPPPKKGKKPPGR